MNILLFHKTKSIFILFIIQILTVSCGSGNHRQEQNNASFPTKTVLETKDHFLIPTRVKNDIKMEISKIPNIGEYITFNDFGKGEDKNFVLMFIATKKFASVQQETMREFAKVIRKIVPQYSDIPANFVNVIFIFEGHKKIKFSGINLVQSKSTSKDIKKHLEVFSNKNYSNTLKEIIKIISLRITEGESGTIKYIFSIIKENNITPKHIIEITNSFYKKSNIKNIPNYNKNSRAFSNCVRDEYNESGVECKIELHNIIKKRGSSAITLDISWVTKGNTTNLEIKGNGLYSNRKTTKNIIYSKRSSLEDNKHKSIFSKHLESLSSYMKRELDKL